MEVKDNVCIKDVKVGETIRVEYGDFDNWVDVVFDGYKVERDHSGHEITAILFHRVGIYGPSDTMFHLTPPDRCFVKVVM